MSLPPLPQSLSANSSASTYSGNTATGQSSSMGPTRSGGRRPVHSPARQEAAPQRIMSPATLPSPPPPPLGEGAGGGGVTGRYTAGSPSTASDLSSSGSRVSLLQQQVQEVRNRAEHLSRQRQQRREVLRQVIRRASAAGSLSRGPGSPIASGSVTTANPTASMMSSRSRTSDQQQQQQQISTRPSLILQNSASWIKSMSFASEPDQVIERSEEEIAEAIQQLATISDFGAMSPTEGEQQVDRSSSRQALTPQRSLLNATPQRSPVPPGMPPMPVTAQHRRFRLNTQARTNRSKSMASGSLGPSQHQLSIYSHHSPMSGIGAGGIATREGTMRAIPGTLARSHSVHARDGKLSIVAKEERDKARKKEEEEHAAIEKERLTPKLLDDLELDVELSQLPAKEAEASALRRESVNDGEQETGVAAAIRRKKTPVLRRTATKKQEEEKDGTLSPLSPLSEMPNGADDSAGVGSGRGSSTALHRPPPLQRVPSPAMGSNVLEAHRRRINEEAAILLETGVSPLAQPLPPSDVDGGGGLVSFDTLGGERGEEKEGGDSHTTRSPAETALSFSMLSHTSTSRSMGRRRGRSLFAENRLFFSLEPISTNSIGISVLDACYIVMAFFAIILHQIFFDVLDRDQLLPTGVIVWFCGLSIFSAVWLVSRFFVRYRDEQWDVVDDFDRIKHTYLRSWFAVDLLYSFPFELVLMFNTTAVVFSTFRHYLRLVRIFILWRNDNPLVANRSWVLQLTLGGWIFTVLAIFVFAFVSFPPERVEDHWVCYWWNYNKAPQVFTKTAERYAQGFYWAAVTFTSTGYGDFQIGDMDGKILAAVACLLTVLIIAIVRAFATSMLTSQHEIQAKTQQKKKMLYEMLHHYEIPWKVQKEVISLFPHLLDTEHDQQFKHLLEALPPFVAEKIELYLRIKTLRAVPLLEQLSEGMFRELALNMQRRYVGAYEVIIQIGDIGAEMFFLIHGVVEVVYITEEGEERWLATLRSGSFFGEIALVEDEPVRTATVQSIVDSELLVLAKDDFEASIERHPELRRRIEQESHKRKQQLEKSQAAASRTVSRDASFNLDGKEEGDTVVRAAEL